MSENTPLPEETSVAAPAGTTDPVAAFEPAFRAIHDLFTPRMKRARSLVPPMTDAWDSADHALTKAIDDHSERKRNFYIQAGLMKPATSARLDRAPLLELMERLDKPESRAVATDLRLDDEFERRGEKRDEELDALDMDVLWAADEQVLGAEGVFEPEARRHILAELKELRERSRRIDAIRSRITTEMRRIRLFSLWEDDFAELDELFRKHKFYTGAPADAKDAGRKAKAGGKARFNELKIAESAGRMMALLAEMGPVRTGPEEFKREAARKTCAPVDETIARMEAVCKDLAAMK